MVVDHTVVDQVMVAGLTDVAVMAVEVGSVTGVCTVGQQDVRITQVGDCSISRVLGRSIE